jgi:hypothetical protein
MSLENTSYRCRAQVMTQLEQLSLELVVPPAGVLFCQTHDQRFQFRRYLGPAWNSFSSEGPFATDQFWMPAKDCVWLEDQHNLTEGCLASFVEWLNLSVKVARMILSGSDVRGADFTLRFKLRSCWRRMMVSKFLSPFVTPRAAIVSRKSVSMCMSDQKTIDPSPVLGSAELTMPGED